VRQGFSEEGEGGGVSIPARVGEFTYYRMGFEERERLLCELRRVLESVKGILFAYVHGGFVKRELFRDVDVAVWIGEHEDPFKYEVDLSSKVEVELKVPVDIHVLNEAPVTFKYAVFTEGRLLFSRDEKARVEVVDEAVREYADLRMLRSICESGK
jgi:predicted nucleotidyltransferase